MPVPTMPVVAVTGGSGKLGRAVVRDLLEHGYDVVILDRVAPSEHLERFTRADLTDYGQVLGALSGIDDRTAGPVLALALVVAALAAVGAAGLRRRDLASD